MAAVSPPLDMLLRLSVCRCGRMSLWLGECQWRADPSVTVSGRRVMNGLGMHGEDGGGWGRGVSRGVCSVYVHRVRAWMCVFFKRKTNDELTRNQDGGRLVNRCIRG